MDWLNDESYQDHMNLADFSCSSTTEITALNVGDPPLIAPNETQQPKEEKSSTIKVSKKEKCRIASQEYREKQKVMMEALTKRNKELEDENQHLKFQVLQLTTELNAYKEQVTDYKLIAIRYYGFVPSFNLDH